MKKLIQEFVKRYKLSSHEALLIQQLLLQRSTNKKLLAQHFHSKGISLEKVMSSLETKTGKKGQPALLSAFLIFASNTQGDCCFLSRKPRLLLLDDNPVSRDQIALQLSHKSLELVDTEEAQKGFQLLLLNARSSQELAVQRFRQLCSTKTPAASAFAMVPHEKFDLFRSILPTAQLLTKPVPSEVIFSKLMESFLLSTHEQGRALRFDDQLTAVLNGRFRVSTLNVGYGGIFVRLDNSEPPISESELKIGDPLTFDFSLSEDDTQHSIRARAQIIWRRQAYSQRGPSGIGVRFTSMSTGDRKRFEDYLTCKKLFQLLPENSANL